MLVAFLALILLDNLNLLYKLCSVFIFVIDDRRRCFKIKRVDTFNALNIL